MSSFFFGRLTDWVLRRRGAVAVLIVLLTAFFLWKMQDLQFDNSNEIWFSEGDPSLERINTFHKLFGNDDFVYLVFDADTLFSPESLRLLSDLVSDIRKKVPYLRDVTWLGNAERIEADAEGIVVSVSSIRKRTTPRPCRNSGGGRWPRRTIGTTSFPRTGRPWGCSLKCGRIPGTAWSRARK